jgi:hypothetical protein
MISLIICSKKQELSDTLTFNIRDTIGVPHEVIVIDNSNNEYSICAAYNLGAAKSKFEVLCFMHDDVLFHTNAWGKIVMNVLKETTFGLLGIAGSIVKTKNSSPWWISNHFDTSEYQRLNIIQHLDDKSKEKQYINPEQNDFAEVVVLDGVWICCRKEIWRKIKFDEHTFQNFHFYDMDFSLSILKAGYKNIVTYKVLIEHFSNGSTNAQWVKESNVFYNKWNKFLPKSIYKIENARVSLLERNAIINHLHTLLQNRIDFIAGLKLWLKLIPLKGINRETIILLLRFLKNSNSFAKTFIVSILFAFYVL